MNTKIRFGKITASLVAFVALSGLALPARADLTPATRLEVFNLVWSKVNERYYDPKFGGVDWVAIRKQYEPQVKTVKDDTEFYALLNKMIHELKQSHFGIIPPAAFTAADAAKEAQAETPRGGGGDTGINALLIDGQAIIVHVTPKSAAEVAGLKPGYVLTVINKKAVAPLIAKIQERKLRQGEERVEVWGLLRALLSGSVGGNLEISYKDETDAEKTATLTLQDPPGEPYTFGALPPIPTEVESKRLEGGVGYIRFNIFLIPILDPVKKAIRTMKDAPGIIIDLRGNVGGLGVLANGIAGTLIGQPMNLGTMQLRVAKTNFLSYPQPPQYKGPVVILTDEISLSTSEILAGGLQEKNRAIVIGRQTGGMVLPSQIEELPGGARLQYVFADFRTPKGVLLEGIGVKPDIEVPLSREALLKSADPTLDAALEYLKTRAKK